MLAALPETWKKERGPNKWKSFLRPIAVFPRRLNERMTLQSSVFTIHGGKHYVEQMVERYRNERIPGPISLEHVDREDRDKPILKRYVIPYDCKQSIMADLFLLGVHEGTLFPEVDRQAVYLQHCWWYASPP